MNAATRTAPQRLSAGQQSTVACRLYGIVPAATRTAGSVSLITHRSIAALVGPVPTTPGRPSRQDLLNYAALLDRLATTTPVIPMRYGTVLPSTDVVRRRVLEPHHDAFAATLARLKGHAQFTVRARYLPDLVLKEVLAERPDALALHRRLQQRPAPGLRMRLGEVVAHAVAAKRRADAVAIAKALRPWVVAARVRLWRSAEVDPIGEVAFLVALQRREAFESAAEKLARQWHGRIRLRLLGPMAPYHFVTGAEG